MCLPCWWRSAGGLILNPPNAIITITLFWKSSCRFFPTRERHIATTGNASGQLNLTCHAPTKQDLTLYRKNGQGAPKVLSDSCCAVTPPNPSENRPPRKFSIKLAHRKRDQGAKSRSVSARKYHFLGLSCASIRSLLVISRWNWPFFDCVCVSFCIGVCVTLSFSSSSWFALQSNSTARSRNDVIVLR